MESFTLVACLARDPSYLENSAYLIGAVVFIPGLALAVMAAAVWVQGLTRPPRPLRIFGGRRRAAQVE